MGDPGIIPFGRYKNQTVAEVFGKDPSYIQWMIQSVQEDERTQALLETARAVASRVVHLPLEGHLSKRIMQLSCWPRPVLDHVYNTLRIPVCEREPVRPMGVSASLRQQLAHLNSIYPSGTGCFIDYLVRRLVAEIKQLQTVTDIRAMWVVKGMLPEVREEECPEVPAAYMVFQDLTRHSATIIAEIFDTSLAHCAWFGDLNAHRTAALRGAVMEHITPTHIDELKGALRQLIGVGGVLLNPALGSSSMGADADIICGDLLIELKVSVKPPSTRDLLQALAYAALASQPGVHARRVAYVVKRVAVWNPLLDVVAEKNISKWLQRDRKRFVQLLLNEIPPPSMT